MLNIMDKEIKALQNFFNDNHLKIYRDSDNKIIIDGNIIIFSNEFTHIPIKIHKLNGSLSWRGDIDEFKKGSLSSLINFPDIVTGDVRIYKNPNLKSLKGCPKIIGGSLQCNNCNISDISELPEKIYGHFVLSHNPITDLSNLSNIYVGKNIELIGINCDINENIKCLNDSSIIITEDHTNNIF